MAEKRKIHRRTQFIVNKRFQLKYVTMLLAMTAVLCVGFAVASNYLINANVGAIASSELISDPMAQALIQEQRRFLVGNLMKVFFIVASIMALLGVYITHKMAGPIFALQRRMKEVVQGDFKATIFKVRKGDEFQDLVEAYNEMIFAFDHRFKDYDEKLQHFTELVAESLKRLEHFHIPPEAILPLRNLLEECEGIVEELPTQTEKKQAA